MVLLHPALFVMVVFLFIMVACPYNYGGVYPRANIVMVLASTLEGLWQRERHAVFLCPNVKKLPICLTIQKTFSSLVSLQNKPADNLLLTFRRTSRLWEVLNVKLIRTITRLLLLPNSDAEDYTHVPGQWKNVSVISFQSIIKKCWLSADLSILFHAGR